MKSCHLQQYGQTWKTKLMNAENEVGAGGGGGGGKWVKGVEDVGGRDIQLGDHS